MKKIFSLLLPLCLAVSACGAGSGNSAAPAETQPVETEGTTPGSDASENGEEGRILIAYFTYGENAPLPDGADASASASIQYRDNALTGNTGLAVGMIAEATGGELFSIRTETQYPDNYDDTIDVGQAEKTANLRPKLAGRIEDPESCGTIFLGYPNWWGDMPMAVYSFLDEYDFSGKRIIPFVTSGGSGFSDTVRAIEAAEPDAVIEEGLSIRDNRVPEMEEDIMEWLARLGFAE